MESLIRRASGGDCVPVAGLNQADSISGNMTFHDLMIYIAAGTASTACLLSFGLATHHLFNYTHPHRQRLLLRIIWTPAVFAIFSFFGLFQYKATNYLIPLASLYEGFALIAVFFLLLGHLAPPTWSDQLAFFTTTHPTASFTTIYIAIVQILPTRLLTTIALLTVEATYCHGTRAYWRSHIIVSVVSGVCTAVCLIALFKFLISHHAALRAGDRRIVSKLALFKALVAVQLIQHIVFAVLARRGLLKPTRTLSFNDLDLGLPSFITCVEAMILASLFIWPYSAREHFSAGVREGVRRLPFARAVLDAVKVNDVLIGLWRAASLCVAGRPRRRRGTRPARRHGDGVETPMGAEAVGVAHRHKMSQ